MRYHWRIAVLFGMGLWLGGSLTALGQITISGVSDRYYNYSDTVTLTIGSQAGYSYTVLLDTNRVPTEVPITVNEVGYHELRVYATNLATGTITNAQARFIVQSSVRSAKGSTENGIPPWTPWPVINSGSNEFVGANLRLILPSDFPVGYDIPVVAWVLDPQAHAVRVNGWVTASNQPPFQVKRGVGSTLLSSSNLAAGPYTYAARIGGLAADKGINLESAPAWTDVSGTINSNSTWGAGAHIYVAGTLTIASGATLTVEAGAVVRIAPAVDIYLDGQMVLNGTVERPIVFMPNSRAQPWGGFWLRNSASQLRGSGAIFTGSGANPNWFDTGGRPSSHRKEQALFYCTNRASITLRDSAAISLAGQLSHSVGGGLFFFNYTRFLSQFNTSGGEHTDSVWAVNDSAFIDSHLETPPFSTFNDGDEDALYLVNIPNGYASGFTNTLIGWTRDDGVDSGGSGAGVLNFKNCWFESIYHEGNSLSGVQSSSAHADKVVSHIDDVFLGVGQAVENGYGAVTSKVDHCLMIGNLCGVRFGDNYNWSYYGRTVASNSICINNHHDVWGMTWQSDTSGTYEGWLYRTNQMDVRSNYLSALNPVHPDNTIWNPQDDGWRLSAFMSTPPAATVGVGFATWTNCLDFAALCKGAPVGLSSFGTNFVEVDYQFQDSDGVELAIGTLVLAPGETVKRIYPAGFDLAAVNEVRLVLTNSRGGELTGETNLSFSGHASLPTVNCWVAGTQVDLGRIGEGVALTLSEASTQTVGVPYRFENSLGNIQSGTAWFAPLETVHWVSPTFAGSVQGQLTRLSLGQPTGAQLGSASNVYFVKMANPVAQASTPLVINGAAWKYYDTVTNAVPGWASTSFDDGSWAAGPSPLGYLNTPKEATTVGYGPNSNAKYITTYFRSAFTISSVVSLSSLTFDLLRDDGAMVYLNGGEVFRENLPLGQLSYTNLAITNVSGTATVWSSRKIAASALSQPLRDGTNVVAVEVHQSSASSSDILLGFELTGNPPSTSPPPPVSLGRFDGRLVVAWGDPSFLLVQATNLAGPWLPVASNSPTYLNPVERQAFYRLVLP